VVKSALINEILEIVDNINEKKKEPACRYILIFAEEY
jgi:hypothetical protein